MLQVHRFSPSLSAIMRSFPSGCWTCKLRHRKCDLQIPACRECTDRRLPCHGYGPKPAWMDGSAAEHQELERIKKGVKLYLKKLRRGHRNDSLRRDATGRSSPERRTLVQTPPAPGATELSSPSLPERALHHDYDNFESPEPLIDAESSLPLTCSSNRESRAALPVAPSQHPTPPYVLCPRLASLIMYYLDHVFVWQFPYYQFKSSLGNRGWLLTCLSNGGSLSHAALALSTLHRDASQKRCSYNQEAFEFHSMALRELCQLSQHTEAETLLNDRAKLAEFIAASLTLISFEVGHWISFILLHNSFSYLIGVQWSSVRLGSASRRRHGCPRYAFTGRLASDFIFIRK